MKNSLYEYHNIQNFNNLSRELKYPILASLFLSKTTKRTHKREKKRVYDSAS